MDITKYKNPSDTEELEILLGFLDDKEIGISFINNIRIVYPDWIRDVIDDYSKDYPILRKNWEMICDITKNKPQKILLVEIIYLDIVKEKSEDYTVLIKACDSLTFKGYAIRRMNEFIRCKNCGLAIPSKELWNFMKSNPKISDTIPHTWKDKCLFC